MRIWDLPFENPFSFTLAADSRFCKIDPFDDQIWELSIARHEPPSLLMHTTYGLRAQSMSVFPRFLFNDQVFVDPLSFQNKPVLQHFLPNYISLNLVPSPEISCTAEYWVPDSHTIAGSYQFQNTGNKVVTFRFELCSNLKPLDEGENMSPSFMGDTAVLQGKTYNLNPVCLLAGPSQIADSPFPALWQDFQIVPGKSRTVYWALSSQTDVQASLEHAREVVNSAWEASIARVWMTNDSQNVEIFTGGEQFDLELAAAQRSAFSLVMDAGSDGVPFVKSRHPDMGYSFAEEGKGVIPQWKKPSAFDAFFLSGFLLPGGASQVRCILDFFLDKYRSIQPAGKDATRRSFREILDQPILCTMSSELYAVTADRIWLNDNLGTLFTFFKLWFTPDQDKDLDGFPEWQTIEQSGLEDSPAFERWKTGAQGLNIRMVESPALAGFLYHESVCLLKLIQAAGRDDLVQEITEIQSRLKAHLQELWNEKNAAFFFRDYETHQIQNGKVLFTQKGNGSFDVNTGFSKPQRLLVQISGKDDTRRRFQLMVTGQTGGQLTQETIDYFNVSWLHGNAYYTTNHLFNRLEKVEMTGMSPEDEVCISTGHHQMTDISGYVPLWSGALDAHHLEKLIDKNLHKNAWYPHGIPAAAQKQTGRFTESPRVLMFWNALIGEGLLDAGRRDLAVDLTMRLMDAIKVNFLRFCDFQEVLHAETGEPIGERGNLKGLAPRRLFLHCLGVQYVQASHLFLDGWNDFPWPVTVKYKGVTLTRHKTDTVITFATGQTMIVSGNEPKEILLTDQPHQ